MKNRILLTVVMALAGIWAEAQTVFRVEAPNVVAADERFNVSFILEGDNAPSDFKWDQGDDFQLVWGPQQGRSTSIQNINGKRTKSSQFTFTYILVPKKTGTFSLPKATARVKGKDIVSESVTIEVVSDGASSGSQSGQQSQDSAAGRRNDSMGISDDDLFMRLSLSSTDVVAGEPITATLKLYQRVNIAGFEDAKFPSFNGFWSQETEAPTNIEFRRETYKDKIYNTAVLRKYVLIPQQSGTVTIDPAELVCLVNIRVSSGGSASIFDGFFDDYRTIRKRIYTPAINVRVSPLPAGAPASFGGGVGKFSISAGLSRDSLATHEAASLIVTIKGKGNVSLLDAPKVTFPPDFEVYDTKVTEDTDKASGGTSGSKTYEYPFIPRSHGDFAIAPISYSYYDIEQGRYVTLKTRPIPFSVAKGSEQDAGTQVSVPSVTRHGVKSLNEDIRYIRTKVPVFASKGDFFVGSGLFWGLSACAVLLSAMLWMLLNFLAVRKADVAGTRTRRATKMALRRLKLAGDYLSQNLYTAFYEELHKALLGFISDKLSIPVSELSRDSVADSLSRSGVDDGLVNEFLSLVDACEFARYSPDAGHDAMNAHYQNAINVISSMDSKMRSKKTGGRMPKAAAMSLLLMLALPVSASAAGDPYIDSLWTSATEAYAEGRWADAAAEYGSIAASGLESPALYCNIGSSYFKAEDYPHAILYYERALKLDPSYSDARYNLEVVSGFIQDRIDPVPEFVLKTWARELCYMLDSDAWAGLFIAFLLLTGMMTTVLFMSARAAWKRTGFFCGIVSLIFALSSIGFSLWQRSDYMKADSAVVMRPVTSVKSSPSDQTSTDLFILHEGTTVRILDEVGEWNNIELADGRQGWILSDDIEVI